MSYRTPLADFQLLLGPIGRLDEIAAQPRFAEASVEVANAILTEAGRISDEVMAPLQRIGDTEGARLDNGVVRTPTGFAEGYKAIAEGGWVGMGASEAHGGMGLPMLLATAVNDMMSGACLSLELAPLMAQGQIEALEHHASDDLKALIIPRLISGEWTATMNLTEPQAGSDVGALSTRAEPLSDGTYAITGTKIFITWADNDFAENVSHLVLARLPDGAPGTRGISLFFVPKNIPETGAPNTLRVVSLEHKLGLHGSPTAVMAYEGATGWLVGAPHGGMAAMFTMMNNARLGVGTQGIGIAEAATQMALEYAEGRKQGKAPGRGTIIEHADVRRMLAEMKVRTFAARAIALHCAGALDLGAAGIEGMAERAAFLTPIAKAFGTDTGTEVADLGIQVHGGMGYIEETGAAQFARDVRVTAIYEGTNGIQALDLVGRKLADGGDVAHALIDEIETEAEAARASRPSLSEPVWQAAESLREITELMVAAPVAARGGVATAYLRFFALVLGARAHLIAALQGGPERAPLAGFYMDRILPEKRGLADQIRRGLEADLPSADDLLA